MHLKIFILVMLAHCMTIPAHSQKREVTVLNANWKFAKGEKENAFSTGYNDSSWETVTVPHDWAIGGPFISDGDGNTGKLPWQGEGWYRHKISIPASYAHKTIYLLFDGVMAFPTVYVNGQKVGSWDYGYNSFYLDITDFVSIGQENVIAVHADTRQHDSRWYPGAGIYRKVTLMAVNPIHVDIWGTQVTTPVIKSNYAVINVASQLMNQSGAEKEITCHHKILSPQGKELVSKKSNVVLVPGKQHRIENTFTLTDPQRWDIGKGILYQAVTILLDGNTIIDSTSEYFGVRSIRFTPDDGFYLNDKRVQLKGVNLHHDHGPLGAAFYVRAMERQLEIMQEMGCNAVRTSHNIPAPELLDLCDRMGILVIDEIFDKYDRKADYLPGTDFEEFAQRNMSNFIRRDRNHPSIFLWSVGNEIGDVQWNINGGFDKLNSMVSLTRRYDPSRPVTLVCDSRNSAALRHFDYYDVHSWNYGRRYDLARQLEPNKAVIISESASTVSTRGFYEWPLPEKKTDFTKSLQVSSYDLNAPEWAEIADDDFMWQQDENYIAGEFVWTGFDYLGEPTPYHNDGVKKMGMTDREASVSSYFGIVDLVGIPKDRYYLYRSYWNEDETTIHILPHWNWQGKEGTNIPVFVYTNGDCAELFLNGKSMGMRCKQPASQKSVERFRLIWDDVAYAPGELKVVAYKEGEKIGEAFMRTAGPTSRLRLTPDRAVLTADGMDLSYVLIEALDKDGNLCPLENAEVQLTVNGSGTIAGVGNGDPQSMQLFQSDRIRLFYGKAMLIIKSGEQLGNIIVTAASGKWQQGEVSILVE